MTDRDLLGEVKAVRRALDTPFNQITPEQHELILNSDLVKVAGKSLNVRATFDALEQWLA